VGDARRPRRLTRPRLTSTPVIRVAIGRHDPQAQLPEPLAARERAPRTRQPLDALLLNTRVITDRAA
jgi:hypothetical protein